MRRALAGAALLAAALAASAGSAPSQGAEVTIPGKLFAPQELDVLVGTTVTWHNADSSTHTVTDDDDVFDSGFVRPGESFARLFPEQGTFAYHCSIHRFMRGSVHVFEIVLRGPEAPLFPGRRARLDGRAPEGVAEVVLERTSPGPSVVVASTTPRADGTFSFGVRAPEPRTYRARAGSASSPAVRVRVTPLVGIARRGSVLVVSTRPALPGSTVLLQVYDRDRFAFVTVARSRLDAASQATIRYSPEGAAHVRAVVRGRRGWNDGFSRPLLLRPR